MPTQRAGSEQPAADPVGTFFGALADAGHLATFEGQSATVRLDVASRDGSGALASDRVQGRH